MITILLGVAWLEFLLRRVPQLQRRLIAFESLRLDRIRGQFDTLLIHVGGGEPCGVQSDKSARILSILLLAKDWRHKVP